MYVVYLIWEICKREIYMSCQNSLKIPQKLVTQLVTRWYSFSTSISTRFSSNRFIQKVCLRCVNIVSYIFLCINYNYIYIQCTPILTYSWQRWITLVIAVDNVHDLFFFPQSLCKFKIYIPRLGETLIRRENGTLLKALHRGWSLK